MPLPRLRAALSALLLFAAPLSAKPPAPRPAAHPALWVVRKGGATVWLFGTIHALPAGFRWRNPKLDRSFAAARELVIEAKIDGDPAAAAATFAKLAAPTQTLPPLAERVAPFYRPALAALEAKAGAPATTFNGMATWAAAFMLFGVSMGDLGVSAANGVEEVLKAQFNAARKPIATLETAEQQLDILHDLPEAQQVEFLQSVLEDPADDKREFAAMLAAWSKGDEAAISASFDKDFKASPALRDALLTRRNAAWADAIAKRLGQPGATLVAVGAGHLAGPGSVVHLLEAKGFRVDRVE
ncbi:MAG: TraB/GumN family protein [Sphingomonadaceae bacterium]|nr:TraB/GumN family protein [Sphingomonadaceae bacterium]